MRYLSVCSGIEAATAAWHPLGWDPVGFCEIEPFPSAVLAHRFPGVPNHGDFTRIVREPEHPVRREPIDILVGGTPCQAFSVAGLRAGLSDARGQLALEFCRLAGALQPRWILWENVPGVLSSGGGRDFGSFLGALVELGYGVAWRVLDAQYVRVDGYGSSVPQRRRRIFVVGHLGGSWERAARVLFEPEGVFGHPPPRRQAGSRSAGEAASGAGSAVECVTGLVAHTLKAEGFDASEDGTGRGQPIISEPVAVRETGAGWWSETDEAGAVDANMGTSGTGRERAAVLVEPLSFEPRFARNGRGAPSSIVSALKAQAGQTGKGDAAPCVIEMPERVRRLTPLECERLQGFPPGWTLIPTNKRNHRDPAMLAYLRRQRPDLDDAALSQLAADGPRYKAIGNSMAVNVMRWLGTRIARVASTKELR